MTPPLTRRELWGFAILCLVVLVLGTALGLGLAALTERYQTHRYEIRLEPRR